ncbi:hypothetical protein Bca52824_001548 [Brassica carinata]|uniref:Uncharacterized protein n=1 Tax=Brassica carinata TaxID=52824 RepID=A0A8X8BDG5_BRACI|nr:hypothetical protein Bca52824_001548 [Brassica carinata]
MVNWDFCAGAMSTPEEPVQRRHCLKAGKQLLASSICYSRSKFEAGNSNGKERRQSKRTCLPLEPLMNVQTRVAMETSTSSGLAPLQLEARSAFQKSRAMSGVSSEAEGGVGLMGQQRGQQQQSMMMMMPLSSRDEAALAVAKKLSRLFMRMHQVVSPHYAMVNWDFVLVLCLLGGTSSTRHCLKAGKQLLASSICYSRSKFEAGNSNGRSRRQSKPLCLPLEPLMNVQTRVAMETSTSSGLAPLQLEARSCFRRAEQCQGQVVVSEVPEIILTCISRDEAALAVAQEAFKALYENASSSLTSVPT